MASPALRPLALGEILDVSFGIYRSRFASLFLVAACVQALPITLRFFMRDDAVLGAQLGLLMVYVIASAVLSSFGVAACTLIVSRTYLGTEISAGDALRYATPFMGKLLAISMLTSLLAGMGLILLIVPGLIVVAGCIVAPVAAVVEAPIGVTEAMGRSWSLTKGFRFRTLVAVLIPCLLLLVPGIAIGVIGAIFSTSPEILGQVLIAVVGVFFYPFLYVVICICYYDLRIRKEGFDLELMAAAAPNG